MRLAQGKMNIGTGDVVKSGDFIHLHICEPIHAPMKRYDGIGRIVVTLRNPIAVYQSWADRYTTARPLIDGIQVPKKIEQSVNFAFSQFTELVTELNPFIFRVDATDIEREVMSLAEFVGADRYQYRFVDPADCPGTLEGYRKGYFEVPDSIRNLATMYSY
jgi:hypothetical protein